MHILQTEASTGWGGQEIRILREALGMRERGYKISFATEKGALLASRARKEGFNVSEFSFAWKYFPLAIWKLRQLVRRENINLINCHSSLDSWMGGLAARSLGIPVLRTRHLSSEIRPGLNSRILYGSLANKVVTTCAATAELIRQQAGRSKEDCLSVPTGIEPKLLEISEEESKLFRMQYSIQDDDLIIGCVCILRSWKGISELIQAAKILEDKPRLKWLIVGGGPCEERYRQECQQLGLEDKMIFTGQLEKPFAALVNMDIFSLLSTASEGVSQASLQAAYLEKPLITTRTGGLGEVCIDGETGFNVDIHAPEEVAKAVERLLEDASLRSQLGKTAKKLVEKQFTWEETLNTMERIYRSC